MRPEWPDDKGPRPIWALQDTGSDERCRIWHWASETDRDSRGEWDCPGS
jgi:hypothetical protein